jgi:hypothetical protein
LPAFRPGDATRLVLSASGTETVLERAPALAGGSANFNLVSPVKELADAALVDKFLAGLASAKALRPVSSDLPHATFDPNGQSSRVLVSTPKQSYELTLGGAAKAPEGARYVAVKQGDQPPEQFVIAKSTAEDLSVDPDGFRLRSMVSVAASEVTRIAIQSPSLNLNLTRGVGRTFLIDGASKLRADRGIIDSLFFQLNRSSANRFLTRSEAQASSSQPSARLTIVTKDPARAVAFDFGGNCPGDPSQALLVRQIPDLRAACVSRELESTLALKPEAFVDAHPFSLHVDEVEELSVTALGAKFRLLRKGTAFVLSAKTDSDVDLETGNQRIAAIVEARGERVPSAALGELGLEPREGSVTVRSASGSDSDSQQEVVRIGRKDRDGNVFMYREQDGATLRVPGDQARAFAFDHTLLYSRKLTEFGPSSFISAEIRHAQTRQLLRRGARAELELESPKGFEPDGALSADLIQALGALNAERFVADADDGSFGLQQSTLSVTFSFKTETNPNVVRTLRLGADTALGVYATLDENGPVFVLPRAVEDIFSTLLIDRAIVSAEPTALAAFSLEAEGHRLRFERHGETLKPIPARSFPDNRVADLLEALSGLRPEAALHTGPPEPAEGLEKPMLILTLSPSKGATQTVSFGAGDSWHQTSVFYLRVSGVNATFVIAQGKVRALRAAF